MFFFLFCLYSIHAQIETVNFWFRCFTYQEPLLIYTEATRSFSYDCRRKRKWLQGKKKKKKRIHGVEGDILKKTLDDSLVVFTG